jgi:hypothetical protein
MFNRIFIICNKKVKLTPCNLNIQLSATKPNYNSTHQNQCDLFNFEHICHQLTLKANI